MIYTSTSGKVYWVSVDDFPTGKYKYSILTGILGVVKAVISPNGSLLAVGGSTDSKVYLLLLNTKTAAKTFTFNDTDTRAITWSSDNSKMYVATPNVGLIYQLLTTSPYTVTSYRY